MRGYLMNSGALAGVALSVVLGVGAESLIQVWVSLEVNMLFFVSLISTSVGSSRSSAAKYLVVQSVGSSMLLASVLLMGGGLQGLMLNSWVVVSLLLKLGLAPAHTWFISFMENLAWDVFLAASTVQKILPIWVLKLYSSWELSPIGLISAGVGVAGSVAQVKVKSLLVYSSIFSGAWLVSCSSMDLFWGAYLLGYMMSLSMVILSVEMAPSDLFSEVVSSVSLPPKCFMFFGLLGLAGSPPTIGFFAKILILSHLLGAGAAVAAISLALFTAVMLYAYIRLILTATGGEGSLASLSATSPKNSSLMFFVVTLSGGMALI